MANSSNKSIGVVGCGFVGGSLATVFSENGFTTLVYDKSGKVASGCVDILSTNNPLIARNVENFVLECEKVKGFNGVFFVCLPTPMQDDGSCDLSIVDGVLASIASAPGHVKRIAVVKSTVPPGSTFAWNVKFGDKLKVVFSPEFLREATALDDMRHQTRIIIGGPVDATDVVKNVFKSAFPGVPLFKTSSTNAEMTKYVINNFLATKVSFANEVYQIVEKLKEQGENIDYDRMIELVTLDERVGKSHWSVPGPMLNDLTGKPSLGFAGSCFIKDLHEMIYLASQLGVRVNTMEGCWKTNELVRPERDWEILIGRAVSEKKKQ